MHIFFSGIGGTAIGPLALIAKQAGYTVSGSDKQDSRYIAYLREHGVSNIHIGQDAEQIASVHARQPIDWYVYSSAVGIENPDAPEFEFCREHDIHMSKRDELLNRIITDKRLKLLAVAGTHGKTTTTAMMIWLLQQIGVAVSYSVGAKTTFSEMGAFDPQSEYFVYECDEFDRNFLAFRPYQALITGIDWDHPDIYPTRADYDVAFRQFMEQCGQIVMWQPDTRVLDESVALGADRLLVLSEDDKQIAQIKLAGLVNRNDAWQVIQAVHKITGITLEQLMAHMNRFPGLSRRFELITPGLYTDYAHTPPKIRGALQMAHELAGGDVVVVYEGLHNTRQHFIRDELRTLFDDVKALYVVPSYLAREDTALQMLSPADLLAGMSDASQAHGNPSQLDSALRHDIARHLSAGDTVLCISAGGGNSLDEWVRREFQPELGRS